MHICSLLAHMEKGLPHASPSALFVCAGPGAPPSSACSMGLALKAVRRRSLTTLAVHSVFHVSFKPRFSSSVFKYASGILIGLLASTDLTWEN